MPIIQSQPLGPALAILALCAPLLAPGAGQAQEGDCAALANAVLEGGDVTSAREVPAGENLPAYCEVRATALPEISIEVRLPLEGWNGKLYQTGCGGFCGVLGRADASDGFINAMGPGLARGYATATSDGGHHGLSVADATWAMADPQAERDWGWRSVPETNRVAASLIEAFYGQGSQAAYFQGCSTGGRMAMRAALDEPEMFAGIIAGAPAMDYTGLVATKFSWLIQANTDEAGGQILQPGSGELIGGEVMAQCDGADGAEDGLIADPRACEVDLSGLACEGDPTGGDCLTDAQLEVVEAWRQGPQDADGTQLYPGGIPEGSEPFWWLWLIGTEESPAFLPGFTQAFGAYMAYPEDPGPGYTPLDFDFDADPARLATMAEVYNADDPDLSAFAEAGGRMIVWHGWADALVTPYKTVDWHEAATEAAGGADALAEHVRLFMIPGLDHCGILPGPGGVDQSSLDLLGALEAWVEDDTPPQTVMAED